LVSVEGTNIENYEDFVTWFADKDEPSDFKGPIQMQIVRGGTTMPLELPLAAPVTPALPPGEITSVAGTEVESAVEARQAAARLLDRESTAPVDIIVKSDGGTTTVKAPVIAAAGPWWPALVVVPAGPARIELVLPN